MTIRIEPAPNENIPSLGGHGPICSCLQCREKRRGLPLVDVVVVPWAPGDLEYRGSEPVAVLEYGGVRIELSLTMLRELVVQPSRRNPVLLEALGEIELRMWREIDLQRQEVDQGECLTHADCRESVELARACFKRRGPGPFMRQPPYGGLPREGRQGVRWEGVR